MKRLFYFLCFLPLITRAQANLCQYVDVSNYKGASYTIECWMYADKIDPKYGAALFALGMNESKIVNTKIGKFPLAEFKTGQWNKLTLTGKFDKQAPRLLVGLFYSGKASYYFDDIKVLVKGQEIPLRDGSFEEASGDTWSYTNTPAGVSITRTDQRAHSGKQSLFVDGSGLQLTDYGENESHGHYADINGNHIYYETYGEGKPLLLLHGCLESIQHYSQQIPELAKSYKVIAMDTRGHGKSSVDTGRVSYELFADDVNQFLNTLQLDSVDIIGWSDGGITGLLLAMQHPEKVGKLAVMGANLYNDETSVFKWVNDDMKKEMKAVAGKNDPRSLFVMKMCRLVLEEPHIDPATLKTIQCPVLVLAGEHDAIKPAHTKLIAASIPHATLKIFPGATHWAPSEIPDVFNKTVLNFFSE